MSTAFNIPGVVLFPGQVMKLTRLPLYIFIFAALIPFARAAEKKQLLKPGPEAPTPALTFDVRTVAPNIPDTILPLSTEKSPVNSAIVSEPPPRTVSPQNSPSGKPVAPAEPSAVPAALPPSEVVALTDLEHDADSAGILEAPTVLLFLSGYRLEIIKPHPAGTPIVSSRTKPLTGPAMPSSPGKADSARSKEQLARADAATAAATTHSLVKINLPTDPGDGSSSSIPEYPSIEVFDRQGNLVNRLNEKRDDTVERPILRDILYSLAESELENPSPGVVRDILDLVAPIEGITIIDENAGRLARILDQAVSLKSDAGARGAVVYINGEINQTFFDNLNVSGLGIPITRYQAPQQSTSPDAPRGYGNLTRYPATVVICEKGQIISSLHLSNDDLQNLDSNPAVKNLLVEFLKLFPEPQDKEAANDSAQPNDEERKIE